MSDFMPARTPVRPMTCTICGKYFTTYMEYLGYRCIDPAHWRAAGFTPPRYLTNPATQRKAK